MALELIQPLIETSTSGKGGRCVGLTTILPLCAVCLEILGASTSRSLKGPSRPVQGLVYLYLYLCPRFITICWSSVMYSAIQKDGLNFVRLYFLNYTWYVNDLHNIWKRRS